MPRPAVSADTETMKQKLSLMLVLGLLAAALPMGANAEAGSTCWSSKKAERRFATKINKARSGSSLGSLKLDPELSRVARRHTKEMIKADRLHHTTVRALSRRVTNWVTLGENVGVGGSVRSLHRAFMNSASHRDNILLKTYNHVGVGTKRASGKLWVTVVFEAQTNPGTTLRMPSC